MWTFVLTCLTVNSLISTGLLTETWIASDPPRSPARPFTDDDMSEMEVENRSGVPRRCCCVRWLCRKSTGRAQPASLLRRVEPSNIFFFSSEGYFEPIWGHRWGGATKMKLIESQSITLQSCRSRLQISNHSVVFSAILRCMLGQQRQLITINSTTSPGQLELETWVQGRSLTLNHSAADARL